jgi:hypothetical protein
MTREEETVLDHVRQFALRIQALGLDDLEVFRREAGRYGIDPSPPPGVTITESDVAGVPCVTVRPHNAIADRIGVHAHGKTETTRQTELVRLIARTAGVVRPSDGVSDANRR